jgi:hypothetical protein
MAKRRVRPAKKSELDTAREFNVQTQGRSGTTVQRGLELGALGGKKGTRRKKKK